MIYLDYAATTPCDQEVIEGMLPFFAERFANASSIDHLPGNAARRAVDDARETVAALVDARPEDVIFTSGSTEANNLALSVPFRVLTTLVEHPSILDTFAARGSAQDGLIAIDRQGLVVTGHLQEQLSAGGQTLVSVIATNNETGVEQDVATLASYVRDEVLLHLDATQAIGTQQIHFRRDRIDGCSISAHKIFGPKGVGALLASSRLRRTMRPVLRGGGHERGLRSGTLNVPGIVGFGIAAALTVQRRTERREHIGTLRRCFLERLGASLGDGLVETITSAPTSPHVLSLRLIGINGRALLRAVRDELAFSLGSACATNKTEPSHVLLALGLDKRAIAETIRISFSGSQSIAEVEKAAEMIAAATRSLSGYSLSA